MKTLSLSLLHDNFFCPLSGQRILGPQTFERSPALIGIWQYDAIRDPDIHDIELLAEWEAFLMDAGEFMLKDFFDHVSNDNWIVFILSNPLEAPMGAPAMAFVFDLTYQPPL